MLREKYVNRTNNIGDEAYHIDGEGYLRHKNHMYVPSQLRIKQIIFKELHDNPCVGNSGYQNLISALNKYLYWPNMKRETSEYVA